MKLTKKILLATDFSRGANDAARVLMKLSKKLDFALVLMHVLPSKSEKPDSDSKVDEGSEDHRDRAESLVEYRDLAELRRPH